MSTQNATHLIQPLICLWTLFWMLLSGWFLLPQPWLRLTGGLEHHGRDSCWSSRFFTKEGSLQSPLGTILTHQYEETP